MKKNYKCIVCGHLKPAKEMINETECYSCNDEICSQNASNDYLGEDTPQGISEFFGGK